MKITSLAICAAIGLMSMSASAQTTQKLSASKANEYGLIYTLPQTAIDITLEAEMTKKMPGEFNNYARLHLGIENAVKQPEYSCRLLSAVIGSHGVANPDSKWMIKLKGSGAPYIMLNEDNCLLSINTETVAEPEQLQLPVAQKAAPTPLETEAARQAVTQDMTLSSSRSKKAEIAAQRIFELREARSDLMSGNADNTPPDGKSLQLALDNITAQEAALTAMFAGTTSTSTLVETLSFMPDSNGVSSKVIARLSPVDGFVDPSDLSGEPIYLTVKVTDLGQLPENEKGETKPFPKGGIAYNIPGTARVTITFRGKEIASKTVKIAQLGVEYGLEPSLFTDKKAPSSAIFSPETGALLELGAKGE